MLADTYPLCGTRYLVIVPVLPGAPATKSLEYADPPAPVPDEIIAPPILSL